MRPSFYRKTVQFWLQTAFVTAFSFSLPFSASMQVAQAEVPKVRGIAVVDMQRVLNETTQGRAARKKLESSSKAKQTKLEKKRQELEAEQEKLKNLAGEQLYKAQEELQKKFLDLQSMYMTLQQELATQEGQILNQMYANSQKIVADLAKELNLDLVLVGGETTVLYTANSLDITDQLVQRYNKQHPS